MGEHIPELGDLSGSSCKSAFWVLVRLLSMWTCLLAEITEPSVQSLIYNEKFPNDYKDICERLRAEHDGRPPCPAHVFQTQIGAEDSASSRHATLPHFFWRFLLVGQQQHHINTSMGQ